MMRDRSAYTEPESRKGGTSLLLLAAIGVAGILLGIAFGVFLVEPGGALYDEEVVKEVVEDAGPAVVSIEIGDISRGFPGADGAGSGFLVDDLGHIVTNQHVIEEDGDVIVKLHDGRVLEAQRLGWSEADDLALLKVDPVGVAGIKPLVLADSKKVKPGQLAIAIGSPFRLSTSVAVGVVSGIGRATTEEELFRPIPYMIQTDAPLNPGNSGGPILNSDGEVVGVAYAIRLSRFQSRIGFAIPSNTVSALLPAMKNRVQVRRPWLGIQGRDIDFWLIRSAELPVDSGVYVTGVVRRSPAETAGIVPAVQFLGIEGDIIMAVDGITVASMDDIVSYLNGHRAGDEVTLSVFRDGRRLDVDLTLEAWPES